MSAVEHESTGPTAFLEIFGILSGFAWSDRGSSELDAYGLLSARGGSMGWVATGNESRIGLWGVNEAGHTWSRSDGDDRRAGWCQVTLNDAPQGAGASALQPLVVCLGDVLARLGETEVDSVRLAISNGAVGALPTLVSSLNWFESGDPAGRQEVRIGVHSGYVDDSALQPEEVLEWLQRVNTGRFQVLSAAPSSGTAGNLTNPAIVNGSRRVEPLISMTFDGVLPEWSFAAFGWIMALMVEAVTRCGGRGPMVITIERR